MREFKAKLLKYIAFTDDALFRFLYVFEFLAVYVGYLIKILRFIYIRLF